VPTGHRGCLAVDIALSSALSDGALTAKMMINGKPDRRVGEKADRVHVYRASTKRIEPVIDEAALSNLFGVANRWL